jgi:hypothetical protein
MGMPENMRGAIRSMVPVVQFMFVAYDAEPPTSSDTRYSSVLATTSPGGDWHNIFTALEANQRITTIFYQALPGRANKLWLTHGREIGYLDMPDDIHNPVNDRNMRYNWIGHLTTAWIDFDTPELDHFFDELRLTTRNLNGERSIRVDYKTNSDESADTWTPFPVDYFTSPFEVLTVGDSGVTGRRIRFRFVFKGDTVTPLAINTTEVRGVQMNEVLYDLSLDVTFQDRLMLMNTLEEDDTALAAIQVLETWKESATPLTLRCAIPGAGVLIDNVRGHIDPVSLVYQEWDERGVKVASNVVFKQL